ncbi:MAG: DNA alkylation repair protein [Bacteroidales bacterium]|nr:DNA alkylation repair protein [Bacteroidales bacterium]
MHEHCGHTHTEPHEHGNVTDTVLAIKTQLYAQANPQAAERMLREGCRHKVNLGIDAVLLRPIAQQHPNNHELALALFRDDMRECKLLATMIESPLAITDRQMDEWQKDLIDHEMVQAMCNMLQYSRLAIARSYEWCLSSDTYTQLSGIQVITYVIERNKLEREVVEPYIELAEELADGCGAELTQAIPQLLALIAQRHPELRQRVEASAHRLQQHNSATASEVGRNALQLLNDK